MKTIRFPRRAVLLGGLAAFLSGCAGKFRSYDGPEVTRLRLYKGQRLLVLDGSDRVLQTYPIGLGFAPQGHKQFEGDGRTPEGTYIVDKRNGSGQNMGVMRRVFCLRRSADHRELRPL